MTLWLRALAWRLVGVRLLPIAAGDVLLITAPPKYSHTELMTHLAPLVDALTAQGVKVNILPPDIEVTTVLHDRARG